MISDSLMITKQLRSDSRLRDRLEEFINENAGQDPVRLRLKLLGKNVADTQRSFIEFAVLQLEARKKYESKLKSLPTLIFPSLLAGEQASNSLVSQFHSNLIDGASSLLDLTAGLGVDFISMAKTISSDGRGCIAIEIDLEKAECLKLNLIEAGLDKAEVLCCDAIEALKVFRRAGRRFDIIFVDPARRDDMGGRLYDPSQCQPDIVAHEGLLFEVSDRILVKNSPMVDIHKALEIFPHTEHLYLTAVRNECKELLVDMRKNEDFKKISTIDILSNGESQIVELSNSEFAISYSGSYMDETTLQEWLNSGPVWLYEPSVTQMKLANWNYLTSKFGVVKSSPNSHIFFSRELHENFPGRILIVDRILDKKGVKSIKGEPRNVVTRNYPLKAVPLIKKLRVNSCNDKFIYGLTISAEEHPLLLDTRLD